MRARVGARVYCLPCLGMLKKAERQVLAVVEFYMYKKGMS